MNPISETVRNLQPRIDRVLTYARGNFPDDFIPDQLRNETVVVFQRGMPFDKFRSVRLQRLPEQFERETTNTLTGEVRHSTVGMGPYGFDTASNRTIIHVLDTQTGDLKSRLRLRDLPNEDFSVEFVNDGEERGTVLGRKVVNGLVGSVFVGKIIGFIPLFMGQELHDKFTRKREKAFLKGKELFEKENVVEILERVAQERREDGTDSTAQVVVAQFKDKRWDYNAQLYLDTKPSGGAKRAWGRPNISRIVYVYAKEDGRISVGPSENWELAAELNGFDDFMVLHFELPEYARFTAYHQALSSKEGQSFSLEERIRLAADVAFYDRDKRS